MVTSTWFPGPTGYSGSHFVAAVWWDRQPSKDWAADNPKFIYWMACNCVCSHASQKLSPQLRISLRTWVFPYPWIKRRTPNSPSPELSIVEETSAVLPPQQVLLTADDIYNRGKWGMNQCLRCAEEGIMTKKLAVAFCSAGNTLHMVVSAPGFVVCLLFLPHNHLPLLSHTTLLLFHFCLVFLV